jgi:hypothetical protein
MSFNPFNWLEFDDLLWVAVAVSVVTILAVYVVFGRRR